MICNISTEQLLQVINSLKSRHGHLLTNSYRLFSKEIEKSWCVAYNDNALLILFDDNNVERIEFYAAAVIDLKDLLSEVPSGRYCIEYPYRKENEHSADFMRIGFELLKTMQRYSNPDIGKTLPDIEELISLHYLKRDYSVLGSSDFNDIKLLLSKTFDSRISHLQDDDSLLTSINNGEFCGAIIDGELKTLLQRKTENNKFYINQVINMAEPDYIHSIMVSELRMYNELGGKYVYSWIAEDNTASIRFHLKYGLNPDYMFTDIMIFSK